MANVIAELVDSELTRPHTVVGWRVAWTLEVSAIDGGCLAACFGDWNRKYVWHKNEVLKQLKRWYIDSALGSAW